MEVAVLGGGVAGCALGVELARGGVDVTLFEASPRLGGLHRSVEAGGTVFDIGTFVFGADHELFAVFPEVKQRFVPAVSRLGVVRSGGELDDYPLTIGGLYRQFGPLFIARSAVEVLAGKTRRHHSQRVSDFVEYYIGPSTYHASGLDDYIERLYLAPEVEIDIEFARQRLQLVSSAAGLRANVTRMIGGLARGERPTSPVPRAGHQAFVRPRGGFHEAYEVIEGTLRAVGVELRMREPIVSLRRQHLQFVLGTAELERRFDHVFSTIPLSVVAAALGLDDYDTPETVALYSLFYMYGGELRWPYSALHNFTPHGQWKRMTIFSRYYGLHHGQHYFTVEGTATDSSDRESALTEGRDDFTRWLGKEALLDRAPVYVDGVVTRQAYPVYKVSSAERVRQLKQRVEQQGVRLVGRQGRFDYISSSAAAGDAREAARGFLASLAQ